MKESEISIKACDIVELFEDLLQEKDINIPCSDEEEEKERLENEYYTKLYGSEYWGLIDKIEDIIRR